MHGSHRLQQLALVVLQLAVLQDALHDAAAVGVLAQVDVAAPELNPWDTHWGPNL